MANEYVALAVLRKALDISGTDRDDLLNVALAGASGAVNGHCGRRFYADPAASPRTYSLGDRVVRDPAGDLLIVDDISTDDGLVVEAGTAGGPTWTPVTDVETGPDNALAKGRPITFLRAPAGSRWTSTSGIERIRVTARWGWPAVPDTVAQVTLSIAARMGGNIRGHTSKSIADRAESFPAPRLNDLERELLVEYRLS